MSTQRTFCASSKRPEVSCGRALVSWPARQKARFGGELLPTFDEVAASLARICDVADALDITVTERAVLGKPSAA